MSARVFNALRQIMYKVRGEIIMKRFVFLFISVAVLMSLMQNVSSLSNESIQAMEQIDASKVCLDEMIAEELPVGRANESFNDASQLYTAQVALEEKKKKADYTLVLKSASDVCNVKEAAFEATDELEIFKETYNSALERVNLSKMERDYQEILDSYLGERFEETLELIGEGYTTLSEIEASQTATKLFVATTTRTIKDFFRANWKKLLVIFGIIIVLLLIFWKAIQKLRIRRRLHYLMIQKDTLNNLIKKLQFGYFGKKNVSESEYRIKLEKFKDMIRDINRQVPLLREDMMKVEKGKKILKSKVSFEGKVKTKFRKSKVGSKKPKKKLSKKKAISY